jgi:hypothetical protein
MTCYHESGQCINHGACNQNDGCMYAPKIIPEMAKEAQDKVDAEHEHRAKVEWLAQKLYEASSSEEEYETVTGKEKPQWRITGLPWDRFPGLELAEHRRDDYRYQAERLLADPELVIKDAS